MIVLYDQAWMSTNSMFSLFSSWQWNNTRELWLMLISVFRLCLPAIFFFFLSASSSLTDSLIPSLLPLCVIQCLSLSLCVPLVRPAGTVTYQRLTWGCGRGWLHPEEQLENTLKATWQLGERSCAAPKAHAPLSSVTGVTWRLHLDISCTFIVLLTDNLAHARTWHTTVKCLLIMTMSGTVNSVCDTVEERE